MNVHCFSALSVGSHNLSFVYYGCPMLCLQSLSSLASTHGVVAENPGEDFDVVSISIGTGAAGADMSTMLTPCTADVAWAKRVVEAPGGTKRFAGDSHIRVAQ